MLCGFVAITQTEIVICEDAPNQETSTSLAASNLTNKEVSVNDLRVGQALTELRRKVVRRKVELGVANQPALAIPASCHAKTFLETVYGNFCTVRSGSQVLDDGDEEQDQEVTGVTRRIVCVEKTAQHLQTSTNTQQNVAVVQLFNTSQLLSHLGSRANSSIFGRCTVVLFYAPWCMFSVRLAPHYNALARAFPTLDVVAIDAYHFSR